LDASQGQKLPSADHAYGKWIPYPYWARFSLRNTSDQAQTWLVTYELPTQDGIELWRMDANQHLAPYPQIDQPQIDQPHSGRQQDFGGGQLFPTWRVTLQAGETQTYLLHLTGYNLMRFPLFAMRDDAFTAQQRNLFLGLGFVLAIPLVVLLYVLTLIRIAEDKSLLIFIVMALAEMLGAAWVSGLLHAALPWVGRWTSGWLGWGAYVLLLGLSAIHARVFMQTKTTDALADRMLLVLAVLWLAVLPLFALYMPEAARLCLLVGGTVHALLLAWLSIRSYQRLRTKSPNSGRTHMLLFIAVWVVYGGSGLLYVAYRVAGLPIYITLMSNFVQGSLVAALLGCAVSVQIIHQRRAMQLDVSRAEDRNHLYAAAHHDLWQPIQSVGLYAAALSATTNNGISTNANQQLNQHYLRGIESAVTAVHDFMESLRHAVITPQMQSVHLDELLAPLVDEYRHIASQKHISLRYRQSRLTIQTDPALLQRTVRNLLSNAIRYSGAGGRVLIGARRGSKENQHWLMVYDNGAGMTAAQAASCFQAYTRADEANQAPEGIGLGLFSVKRITAELGQEVKLVSRLGKGTAIGVSVTAINPQNQG
jgi:signal transduction histidine kinase